MTKKGEGNNKFLPAFDKRKAQKLKAVLEALRGSAHGIGGLIRSLDDVLKRPSSVRNCDVALMTELFDAIKQI